MFQDRRIYPRRKAMLSFRVVFGGNELNCVTTDISPTGAFFAGRDSPPIGSKVGIIVRPSGMKIAPVHIDAEVVRHNPLGGGLQPGFAVHFLTAQSESGGASIYHVLRQVLRLAEISPDDLPGDGHVVFHFAPVGERIDLRSAHRRPSSAGGRASSSRIKGRPATPIQDELPAARRGSRVRPAATSPVVAKDGGSRRLSSGQRGGRGAAPSPRRPSSHATVRTRSGAHRLTNTSPRPSSESTQRGLASPTSGRPGTPNQAPRTPPRETTEPVSVKGAARRISADQANVFTGARPMAASGDSGVFSPPGHVHQPARPSPLAPQLPTPAASPSPAPPLEKRPAASSIPSFAPAPSPSPPPQPPRDEAAFSPGEQEDSRVFNGKRPETSRIVAPFSDQAGTSGRKRSASSSWSVYESGAYQRATARRRSDVVIQDDPFATGARKVAARFRQKEQEERERRREEREREREQLRAKLQARRRDSAALGAAFSQDGDGGERSMIFARSGQASTIGGPMLTGMAASPALPENTTVAVQTPVTYELDGRFVPGVVISAAPLALEIHSLERVPQLDQKLVLNFPVHEGGRWQTIFLMGKLLRVPEARDGGQAFVLHIERVQESGELVGAYNRFLAAAHAADGDPHAAAHR